MASPGCQTSGATNRNASVSSDTRSGSAGHRGSIHDVFSASLHIDIAEVQTAEGKLYLFVGIDRTSKFAVIQLVEKADRKTAWEFLQHMHEAIPHQVHTILTDNVLCREFLAA